LAIRDEKCSTGIGLAFEDLASRQVSGLATFEHSGKESSDDPFQTDCQRAGGHGDFHIQHRFGATVWQPHELSFVLPEWRPAAILLITPTFFVVLLEHAEMEAAEDRSREIPDELIVRGSTPTLAQAPAQGTVPGPVFF